MTADAALKHRSDDSISSRHGTSRPHPRHVAIVADRYLPVLGGAERQAHMIARGLVRRGTDVTVLTRRVEGHLRRQESRDGVRILRFGRPWPRALGIFLCKRSVERRLGRASTSIDAVLVVGLTYHSDLLPTYRAHRRTGVPFVLRTTSPEAFAFMLGRTDGGVRSWLRRLAVPRRTWRRALDAASAVTVQSGAVHRTATAHGVEGARVVENGVDTARFRPAEGDDRARLRRRLDLPEKDLLVANAGRFARGKNQETLVRALGILGTGSRTDREPRREIHDGRRAVHLLLLGAREPRAGRSNENAVRDLVRERGLEASVTVRTDVEEVEDHLRASDLFVFPSLAPEGMPNALLEAMACGLPSVCVDTPAVRAVATPETSDFVDVTRPEAIAGAIGRLADDQRRRDRLGRVARQRAVQRFGHDRMVERYADLLGGAGREASGVGRTAGTGDDRSSGDPR